MAAEPWILLRLYVFERKKAGYCYSCTFWTHKIAKNPQNVILANPVWRVFGRLLGTFSEVVFVCVLRVHLFRLLGDLWVPKASERVPKWSPK